MPAATSSRRGPSHHETSYAASAPIPIPIQRRTVNRCDEASSPDLIFHMSPDVTDETPLAQLNTAFILNETATRLNQRSGLTFASRFGHIKSPSVTLPPYYDEPFLYSIPRLPARPPSTHNCTRSEVLDGTKATPNGMEHGIDHDHGSTFSASSSSIASSFSSHTSRTPCSAAPEIAYDAPLPLTSAFQNSLSPLTSVSTSNPLVSLEDVAFKHPISPPASVRGWKGSARPARSSPLRRRKNLDKAAGVAGLTLTSAAEPVVSFAQAGLGQSNASDRVLRTTMSSRNGPSSPVRTRSPYPVMRGRRGSPLHSRLKVSDEDLAGTLENMDFSEKFGLERFLAPGFLKKRSLDENVPEEEPAERGRTKSRARGGRRG